MRSMPWLSFSDSSATRRLTLWVTQMSAPRYRVPSATMMPALVRSALRSLRRWSVDPLCCMSVCFMACPVQITGQTGRQAFAARLIRLLSRARLSGLPPAGASSDTDACGPLRPDLIFRGKKLSLQKIECISGKISNKFGRRLGFHYL